MDTAELYGTYAHIGLALKQAQIHVSTKCYAYDDESAERSFRNAVEGIGREYIDIFMLHEQESIHTLRGHERALNYFNKMKERGYIGAVGISTHHIAAVRAAVSFGGIDVVHPILNVSGLGIADGTRAEMEAACKEAHEAGIGVFAMKPFGGGHLLGKRIEAARYLTALPFIDAIAVGMQSLAEIEFNAALFDGRTPSKSIEAEIDCIERELIIQDWCIGCGKCVLRCSQKALYLCGEAVSVDNNKCVKCGYCAPVCPEFCIKII